MFTWRSQFAPLVGAIVPHLFTISAPGSCYIGGVRRLFLLVFRGSILTVAAALLLGGTLIVWFGSAHRNDEGFFSTDEVSIYSKYVAVTSRPARVKIELLGRGAKKLSRWLVDPTEFIGRFLRGDNQVVATNNDSSKGVFIGLASTPDVKAFLEDTKYHEMKEVDLNPFDSHPFRVKLASRGKGKELPGEPGSEAFWIQSVQGAGTQALAWERNANDSLIVLMNDDGSAGVDMTVTLGAGVPVVFRLGAGLLVGGGVALAAGGMMIFSGARAGTGAGAPGPSKSRSVRPRRPSASGH